jgi:hypothetical protein
MSSGLPWAQLVRKCVHFYATVSIYRSLLRMRNVSVKAVEKKHILCSVTFSENGAVYETVGIYGRARQRTDYNIIRRRKDAICLPDN